MVSTKQPSDWTPEIIQRFWDYNSRPHRRKHYFSLQSRERIACFLEQAGMLQGEILDFGCGPGDLLETLLARGLSCRGCEFSNNSAEIVENRFRGKPNWHGCERVESLPSPLTTGTFDLILCLETVEHLPDAPLTGTLQEIRRLLKPLGCAFITTPHAEQLAESMTYCPFCDSEYHEWQHVRAWTAPSLRSTLEVAGFEVLFCEGIDLYRFNPPPVIEESFLRSRLRTITREFLYLSGARKRPPATPGPPPVPGLLAEIPRQLQREGFRNLLEPGGNLCAIVRPRATK